MIPKDLSKWIFASVVKHFDDLRDGIHMFVEGESMDSNETHQQYFELRIDGPYYKNFTRNEYLVKSDINLLCSAVIDGDSHRIHRLAGFISSLCTTIGIRKYGADPVIDNGDFISCMNPEAEVKILHFGQIQMKVPLLQAAVRVRYSFNYQS